MTGVPIDEAALQVAKDAVQRVYDLNHGSCSEGEDVEVAVSTYLEAVGAEVEYRGLLVEDGKRSPLEYRVVTPWKPPTDTKEPLRPAAGSMIEDRPCRDGGGR